ncbi:hypothetical protein [Nocardioides psychrotolerans]|uniref:Uncharacterized protein n=1 Tax=Nocardioides psychrotolerans TaxID=1005945 RepID=A0A1I3JUH1_9ACTN|nr:hypothetical protein [Nocardioides psychrotolerans]SFI63730.1 hypothetical protein SAMN05216561_11128 [Nocardioides psychrotolerans]
MTTPLAVSARVAWWGTAWLRGHVVADQLLDAVLEDSVAHVVSGIDGVDGDSILGALARLRALGAHAFGATFPAEGDLVGLGGPAEFNRAALEVGEGVVAVGAGIGLTPRAVGPAYEWVAHLAAPRQVPDVGEADRALRAALLHASEDLAALEVAKWRPEVADRLLNLRHRTTYVAPPGVPDRCIDLAARGQQALEIVEIALEDDGGALSVVEIEQRRAALVPLERAGRRALVAAFSPEGWPPG